MDVFPWNSEVFLNRFFLEHLRWLLLSYISHCHYLLLTICLKELVLRFSKKNIFCDIFSIKVPRLTRFCFSWTLDVVRPCFLTVIIQKFQLLRVCFPVLILPLLKRLCLSFDLFMISELRFLSIRGDLFPLVHFYFHGASRSKASRYIRFRFLYKFSNFFSIIAHVHSCLNGKCF